VSLATGRADGADNLSQMHGLGHVCLTPTSARIRARLRGSARHRMRRGECSRSGAASRQP